MPIGVLTFQLHLPGCASLKEKRSRLKPLLARLHREFNISVAEMNAQDVWKSAEIACVLINNNKIQIQRSLQHITRWIEINYPDFEIVDDTIEII
jgi:uncharacterized protein YlxP (DUF503 family)